VTVLNRPVSPRGTGKGSLGIQGQRVPRMSLGAGQARRWPEQGEAKFRLSVNCARFKHRQAWPWSVQRRRKPSREDQDRQAILLMRALQGREEKAHEKARRLEKTRPEMADRLFGLGRDAFALNQVLQREWAAADYESRDSWLAQGKLLVEALDEAV
jgi:hypothetical protein